jgi:hypothetical protein
MTKQSGLGDRLFVAGYDLSGDIGALGNIGGGPAAMDVTGIDKSGHERLGGLIDGRFEYSAWFNPGTDRAHDRLSSLPTGSQVLTYCRGTALGGPAAGLVGKQVDYAGKRGNDGALSFEVSMQVADGYAVEWGEQATPGIRTDTTATAGGTVDGGAATAFGLVAYLHVFALTGTSVTVAVEDSANGSTWAALAGAAFTPAAGITSQRIATARDAAVRRYLRVVTTGTFTNAQFHVLLVRGAA